MTRRRPSSLRRSKRRRSLFKSGSGRGLGGGQAPGELGEGAAAEELFIQAEEASPEELRYMGQIIRERSGCIHNFYLYEGDFSEGDITLQEGETVDLRLVTPKEIERMSDGGEFLDFAFNRMRAVYGDIFFYRRIIF